MSLLPRPDAFVRGDFDGAVEVPAEALPDRKQTVANVISFAISRDMAIDLGLIEPTPQERARREAEYAAFLERQAVARAQPGPPVTVDTLLGYLGWTAEYAAHRLHPACDCDDSDDAYTCSWADELALTRGRPT